MKLNAFHWSAHKGGYKIPTPERFTAEITVAGVGELLLVGHTEDGSVILHSDLNRLYIRANFEGFQALEIRGKEFGCKIKLDGVELGEELDQAPPPARKQPTNLLQKLREKARQEMGYRREQFLENNTGLPGYEDDIELFEEDEIAIAEAERNKVRDPVPGGDEPISEPQDEPDQGSKDD